MFMQRSALQHICSLNRLLAINNCHNVVRTSFFSRVSNDGPTKKTTELPKISVVFEKKTLIMTLLEAQKLAKRRNLNLIHEEDPKNKRATYKLVAATETLDKSDSVQKADNNKSQLKSEKQLTIGSRISDHDLSSRLKNISKWLAKQHEVRVLIQCSMDDIVNGEKIHKTIEQSISAPVAIGKIVKKHMKGSSIRFTIIPVLVVTPSEQ